MSDTKVKSSPKGVTADEGSSEKRGRGRPRKKTQESSGSPTSKRARGRPKGSTKKGTNKKPLNTKKSEGTTAGSARGRPSSKKQEEEEGGTTESSEDQ
ncbi:high mobility group protein HMG-I/HMG-Y isoform X2 [Pelobates fuscus]